MEKPPAGPKRQEVFSCAKLSPFMQELYKFEDVYSKANVKFNSSAKQVNETPRALKYFLATQSAKVQQHRAAPVDALDATVAKEQAREDSAEQKKRKRFLKAVSDRTEMQRADAVARLNP